MRQFIKQHTCGINRFSLILLLLLLTVCAISPVYADPPYPEIQHLKVLGSPEVLNPYFSRQGYLDPEGRTLTISSIHGPSQAPPSAPMRRSLSLNSLRGVYLPDFPSYSWNFGCTAVAAAMVAAYYDNHDYGMLWKDEDQAYPLTDTSFGYWTDRTGVQYPNNPLIATRRGLDGLQSDGMIEDLWVSYLSNAQDPYLALSKTRVLSQTAIGEPMATSKSTAGNIDGGSLIGTYNDGSRTSCAELMSHRIPDANLGRSIFYEQRGYTVGECYNQKVDTQAAAGFTLKDFQDEIDSGHPVLINLQGHSIVGFGYSNNLIFLRDTWDSNPNTIYTMYWGGSYAGMQMDSVSIVHMEFPVTQTQIMLSNGTIKENQPENTLVGEFTVEPANTQTGLTFSLVTGAGDTDNDQFRITSQNELMARYSLNYDVKNSYSIRVRAIFNGNILAEQVFTVLVENLPVTLSSISVPANMPPDTLVGTFIVDDPAGNQGYSFTFEDPNSIGAQSFSIQGDELRTAKTFTWDAEVETRIPVTIIAANAAQNYSATVSFNITIAPPLIPFNIYLPVIFR